MRKLTFLFLLLFLNAALFAQSLTFEEVEKIPVLATCDIDGTEEERKACTEKKVLTHILSSLVYPLVAKENGFQGLVVARFIITKAGEIDSISIKKGVGGGCDEEVIYIVGSMNSKLGKWTPGKQNGKIVPVNCNLSVVFKLAGVGSTGNSRNFVAGNFVARITNSLEGETVYGEKEVDKIPTIKACQDISGNKALKKCRDEKLVNYVISNMKYPTTAIDRKIEGLVVIKFIVTKTGEVKNIELGKGIGGGCEVEVLKVVKKMISEEVIKWDAGIKDGSPVHVRHNLLIRLEVTKEMKKARKQELKN